MSQQTVLLLLGSDLGQREQHLAMAKQLIEKAIGRIIKCGIITETAPVEFTSDTLFLNQIIEVETPLSPVKILSKIIAIEVQMGRVYTKPKSGEKYVSRIIDIDILYLSHIRYQSKKLNIPHPQVFTRKFVKDMLECF